MPRRDMATAHRDESTAPPSHLVTKTKFAMLCGQSTLDGEYDIHDPNSEMCLANSTWCEEQMFTEEMLCNDTFFNASIKETPAERKVDMEASLAHFPGQENRPASQWKIMELKGDENCQLLQQAGGLAPEDAWGCACALSFYTGDNYTKAVRSASLNFRQNNLACSTWSAEKLSEFKSRMSIVSYYLMRALCVLPAYWGPVVRCAQLGAEDLALYEPGNLVTWFQWSSCKKGFGAAGAFAKQNTTFKIWSISGRHIDTFSNFGTPCGKHEDEVLLLPGSRFLVLKVDNSPTHTTIHMRQVELGITKGLPLLWVDDHILDHTREMKKEMEKAQTLRQSEHVIKYILKPSTALAIAYLRSPFGRCHANNSDTRLRIMSDMGRPAEPDGDRAGANLVKALRQDLRDEGLGLECPVLIFTSSESKGKQALKDLGVEGAAEVTVSARLATRFASFESDDVSGLVAVADVSVAP